MRPGRGVRGPRRLSSSAWSRASASRSCVRRSGGRCGAVGEQFVMGRDIAEALERAADDEGPRVPAHARHARRVGADRARRRRALLSSPTAPRSRRLERLSRRGGEPPSRLADHLGQAVGARTRATNPRDATRCSPASRRASRPLALRSQARRHRAHGRRGGVGASRALARAPRPAARPPRRSRAGTASAAPVQAYSRSAHPTWCAASGGGRTKPAG